MVAAKVETLGEWEGIDRFTARLPVVGGWLVEVQLPDNFGRVVSHRVTFVADPEHRWKVKVVERQQVEGGDGGGDGA